MIADSRLRKANDLMLQWHHGASTIGLEAFPAWAVATLRQQLRFDGVVWGLLVDSESVPQARISGLHLHRLAASVLDELVHVRPADCTAMRAPGRIVTTRASDPAWHGPQHAAFRAHAHQHGLTHSMSACLADPTSLATGMNERSGANTTAGTAGRQFILLSRQARPNAFSVNDAREFELLAPHLMQAYATCRRSFLDNPKIADRRSSGFAVALVDVSGVLHDWHPRFVPMMQREWSDWPGQQLPDALLEVAARRTGTRWRFLGTQVVADFAPVDNLYLVTARPRHVADVLTKREAQIAQRYAYGDNFREIAASLNLAPATVRSHLRNVFSKLQVRNKTQLATALR